MHFGLTSIGTRCIIKNYSAWVTPSHPLSWGLCLRPPEKGQKGMEKGRRKGSRGRRGGRKGKGREG